MKIERLELALLTLPLVHFFATCIGRIVEKPFVIVRLDGGGTIGQCHR